VLRGQKADIWEGGHRVPFIIRGPGVVSKGTVNRDVISLIDFYATFTNILNEAVPKEALDSYNILPTLYGEALEDRKPLIHRAPRSGLFAIRKGSWKLIEERGSGGFTQPIEWKIQRGEPKGQLYNLDTDLSESKNLWDSHRGIVERLQDILNEYREQNE
ncbi:MAG: arylsulfatase, partial [Bacteroidales bacterium]